MSATIVRYRLKSDRIEENVAYVEAVFAELADAAPAGVRYATFQAEDGVSFTHVAVFDTPDAQGALGATAAFGRFVAEIGERCEEPPLAVPQRIIGSYRAFV